MTKQQMYHNLLKQWDLQKQVGIYTSVNGIIPAGAFVQYEAYSSEKSFHSEVGIVMSHRTMNDKGNTFEMYGIFGEDGNMHEISRNSIVLLNDAAVKQYFEIVEEVEVVVIDVVPVPDFAFSSVNILMNEYSDHNALAETVLDYLERGIEVSITKE